MADATRDGIVARGAESAAQDVVAGVRLMHADRLLYPEQGITKLELARYYERIRAWFLPYLVNRPLAVVRCPSGTGKPCFFQKHPTSGLADSVGRVELEEGSGQRGTHLSVKSLDGVIALVQIGVLEFHVWGCRVDLLEKPDIMVFDLDPGPAVSWPDLIRGGLKLSERLEQLGLNVFTKLTGGKGIHLVVPLTRKHEWGEVTAFARAIAQALARDEPARFTAEASKAKREGRIVVDYLRNA